MELKAGAIVNKRLRLVRPIGKGGMGAVWVAFHEALKTEVAVKFVTGEAKDNDKMVARFEREAAIAAKLKSPHVAPTYDHGLTEDGTPFIVMELLEGESLQKRLGRGQLSLHETALVVSQTAQALGKAHKLGIIHRDVKPANLFLLDTDYELFVKLLDFGIAKLSSTVSEADLTKTGSVMGSLLYMSPEQLTEVKNVDGRTDLWALAVVAYRCLATAPPFMGEAIGNVMMAIMNRDYRPISVVRSDLPMVLDDWFAKAFAPDIEARFQTAKEMAKALRKIARDAPDDDGDRKTADALPSRLSHDAIEAGSSALNDTALADEAKSDEGGDGDERGVVGDEASDAADDATRITGEQDEGADDATRITGERGEGAGDATRITGERDEGAMSSDAPSSNEGDAAVDEDGAAADEHGAPNGDDAAADENDAAVDEDGAAASGTKARDSGTNADGARASSPSLPPLTAVRSDKELAATKSVWADESTLTPTTFDEAVRKRRTGLFAAAAVIVVVGAGLYAAAGTSSSTGTSPAASASNTSATTANASGPAATATPNSSAAASASASAAASGLPATGAPTLGGASPSPPASTEIDRSYPVPAEPEDDDIYR